MFCNERHRHHQHHNEDKGSLTVEWRLICNSLQEKNKRTNIAAQYLSCRNVGIFFLNKNKTKACWRDSRSGFGPDKLEVCFNIIFFLCIHFSGYHGLMQQLLQNTCAQNLHFISIFSCSDQFFFYSLECEWMLWSFWIIFQSEIFFQSLSQCWMKQTKIRIKRGHEVVQATTASYCLLTF